MAIKGAILGDILGSQYELYRPENLDWKNCPLISDYPIGFSDDTVMTLAVKKALVENSNIVDTMVEVGRKYPYCGFGGTFNIWINGSVHEPYNSWGNGSAMRTSFIGEHYNDFDEMQKTAATVAAVSHNHPEGIKGAVVTSTCIWMARHGKTKQDIFNYVLSEYPIEEYQYSIGYSLDAIRPRYEWDVSCPGSVPAAMRCFYESSDYESFIRNVYSLPCDSDTFGAIAGGVAEEFYGGFGNIDADKVLKTYLDDYLYELMVL